MNRLSSNIPKSSPDLRNASRAKSCTRCRQAKLACDARRTLTEPCSRCRSKNLDCRFDANFKRVSTRKLTEEISHGLHALRSTEQTRLPEHFSLRSEQNLEMNSVITENGNKSPSAEAVSSAIPIEGRTLLWPSITNSDRARSYTLGKLNLESLTVVELFQHFGMHYHPYAMFLQPCPSLSDLLTRSPLLFWTIVLVASQDHAQFAAVYQKVATEHEGLLSPILQRAIQQIETIHALLLLCLWPISQSRYFYNPAWNYVGLAIHAAIQINCHSPLGPVSETNGWNGLGHVAVSELSTVDQARTWLGCFWVGTVIATFYGFPPPMSTQHQMRSIDKAISATSNSIPSWWCTLFSVIKITNSGMDTLGGIEDHALHFSLTQMFDDQLDELKGEKSDLWRSELEIEWCNAKLYLYALTFTVPATPNSSYSTQIQIHRQAILHKVLEASSNLITELTKLGQLGMSDLYPGGLLNFVPKPYFTALFNATTFLLRFMATYITRTPAQESLAMGSIVEAHKIFQSFPLQRELTRAAIHIETFIDILKDGAGASMNELVVKNKLGASIMFDAVFHACRQRNIDPRSGKVLPVQEWKTVSETFARRLPEAPAQKMGDDNGKVNGVTGHESSGLESVQQSSASGEQNPQWWEEWDNYIDLFQVGVEQWGAMDMEQSTDDSNNLGELGGFMYT